LFVDSVDEWLQGVVHWAFAAFEEDGGWSVSVAIGSAIETADTGEVDLVFLTID
jgi:ABC-type tungstate transport system permease subunit